MKHDEYIYIYMTKEDNVNNTEDNNFIDRGIKPFGNAHNVNKVDKEKCDVWPPNTCLIVGDSILNNLDESTLSKKNSAVKIRAFPGANSNDMYSYIIPLIRKKPSYMILHVGINDIKKCFYENLSPKLICDNKRFWQQVKPFFSDNPPPSSKIILVGDCEILSDSEKCAEIMNNFFSDAALNLDIDRELYTENVFSISDPVMKAIEKYKGHPSITKILEHGFKLDNFNFLPVSISDMEKQIGNLDSSKAHQKDNIPPKGFEGQ